MMQFDFDIIAWFLTLDPEIQETFWRYVYSMVLLVILLLVSRWKGIGIGNKLIIGTVRGTIQILLMATILSVIFDLQDIIIIFGVLIFMAIFGAHTARMNLPELPGVFRTTLPGILIGSLAVMAGCVAAQVIPSTGEFVIPMGGMLIGNTVGLCSLIIQQMWSTAQKQRNLLETALALGASPSQATELTIREAINTGLLHNLNRYASLGIVTIPGLMSGMIIGGTMPVVAAFYQVMIFIMIFLSCVVGALITGRLFLKEMFNERIQLMVPPPEA